METRTRCRFLYFSLFVTVRLHSLKYNSQRLDRKYRGLDSETPPGENQNLLARLTVRTYVWIVPDWTLQQSMAKSTERQVQQIAYQGKLG